MAVPTYACRHPADRRSGYLVALRALCQLVATGRATASSGSITVSLDSDGDGMALVRAAERVAADFGVEERVQLDRGRGVIEVWREDRC